MESSKEEVGVNCSEKAIILSKNTPSSVVSTEPAKAEFDLVIQKIKYQGNTNVIDLPESRLKEGTGT